MALKILITNDDGIGAPGIEVLTKWASQHGEVTIVAPKTEQSGKSHSVNLHSAFEIKEVEPLYGAKKAVSVDSTPSDCIRVAKDLFWDNYDLILSGINRGFNVGHDIVYSGTTGAIFEAAYLDVPAVAVSTIRESFFPAEKALERIYSYFLKNGLFRYAKQYNVNIPAEDKGIRMTFQGTAYYKDHFVPVGENLYKASGYSVYQDTKDLTKDLDAVMNGYITVSPLTVGRVDKNVLEKLLYLNE